MCFILYVCTAICGVINNDKKELKSLIQMNPSGWVAEGKSEKWVLSCIQARFYVGTGAIAPKPRPCPQEWHETLFDELKTSAYRCKNERSVAFKIRQNTFLAGSRWEITTLPSPPSRLGRGHASPYPIPLVANGASIFAPPVLGIRQLRLLNLEGTSLKYVFCRTAPGCVWKNSRFVERTMLQLTLLFGKSKERKARLVRDACSTTENVSQCTFRHITISAIRPQRY